VLMHHLTPQVRTGLLIAGVTTVLVVEGLAPFDFTGTPASFDLWPFLVWFDMSPGAVLHAVDWTAMLGRMFLFGALFWLLREARMQVNMAITLVTASALTIEIAQLWLPNQSASITDPVLALAMGLVLRSLERSRRRVRLGSSIPPPAHSR
jgi:VanZ family protein